VKKLIICVVGELKCVRQAAGETGVVLEQLKHLGVVTGEDEYTLPV